MNASTLTSLRSLLRRFTPLDTNAIFILFLVFFLLVRAHNLYGTKHSLLFHLSESFGITSIIKTDVPSVHKSVASA